MRSLEGVVSGRGFHPGCRWDRRRTASDGLEQAGTVQSDGCAHQRHYVGEDVSNLGRGGTKRPGRGNARTDDHRRGGERQGEPGAAKLHSR